MGESAVPDLLADPRDPQVIKDLEYRFTELQKDIKKSGFDYADKLYHNNPNWLGIRALAYQNTDWIAEGGVEFIKTYKDDPFLLYMATTIPHAPLDPERSWQADRRITADFGFKFNMFIFGNYFVFIQQVGSCKSSMSTQLNFGCRRKKSNAKRDLRNVYKSRFRQIHFHRNILHQGVLNIFLSNHHASRIALKGLFCKRINLINCLFHFSAV